MRSEKKEHIFIRLRKSVTLYLKEKIEFIDVKIMSYVLSVVLMIAIIAATVAWFTMNETVKAKGLHLQTASAKDVEVSLDRENWKDISGITEQETGHTFEQAVSTIKVAMPAFQNIYDKDGMLITSKDSRIMAPGTYGSFSFYVKIINEDLRKCSLNVYRLLDTVNVDEELGQEIESLFQGHILCFAQIEGEDTCRYIDSREPVEIGFEAFNGESRIKKITVYWVWPYEYKDISADTVAVHKNLSFGTAEAPAGLISITADLPDQLSATGGNLPEVGNKLAFNQVFDWSRYKATIEDYRKADAKEQAKICSDWYDYADTLIGSYVENMLFHIEVKGVKADGR